MGSFKTRWQALIAHRRHEVSRVSRLRRLYSRLRVLSRAFSCVSAITVKRCICGASYTIGGWAMLPRIGSNALPSGRTFELRNCSCGSTLALCV